MRIAAIDIGTNSIHTIIAEVHGDGTFKVVDQFKDMIRLGAGETDHWKSRLPIPANCAIV